LVHYSLPSRYGPVTFPVLPVFPIFELADPSVSVDIVRVRSQDRRSVFYMGYTVPIERPAGTGRDRQISLAEARPGQAPRVSAWYPTGANTGHRFIYRDHVR
jgi:hypothetical protein